MLDSDTKRRIDTARDILVGKVPNPQSQVEQITIALIYKFMDDMDAAAEELGGSRSFFAGEFARYGWAKLMRGGLGGHETLNLYAEAIERMPENPGIPALFRDIFKNAYLPYRDPETLRAFLKIIDEFAYDHSERLGDAFEYLLSVLGSQGDAGQFRTPRHIIDFIVEIVDPKKTDVVLDPACGTAGFLISAYKHILKANGIGGDRRTGHDGSVPNASSLTPDERDALSKNIRGYDISPDMVRLSLVNLYLHGFAAPLIFEYDTLTSQDRWNERADVILANPPFMSPKGGIKPHNRFGVQSKRSEVLFVDYIAEHLTSTGRAGVIVPEGIIFQSQTAYRQLRKMLVENALVAVVSLPAGVFNPYAGVKTSLLFLDQALARRTNRIAFFKIENDGYGLGAQRRPIDKNDLPAAAAFLKSWFRSLSAAPATGLSSLAAEPPTAYDEAAAVAQHPAALIVPKTRIAADGDYNLNGERYRESPRDSSPFPMVSLGDVCELVRGVVFSKDDEAVEGGFRVLRANNIDKDRYELKLDDVKLVSPKVVFSAEKKLRKNDIFICLASGSKDHIGKVALITEDTDFYFGGFMGAIRVKSDFAHPVYLLKQLTTGRFNDFLREQISGANINNLSREILYRFHIPLPPLSVQQEIVSEIERYQRVIDGARAVVDNYRPHIPIDPVWPLVNLCEATEINPRKSEVVGIPGEITVSFVPMSALGENSMLFKPKESRSLTEVIAGYTYFRDNDVLLAKVTPCFENGKAGIARNLSNGIGFGSSEFFVIRSSGQVLPEWIYFTVANAGFRAFASKKMTGTGGLQRIPRSVLENHAIPLPPLATQRAIVEEIEAEQAVIDANRDLILRFEKKIQAVLDKVWGKQ